MIILLRWIEQIIIGWKYLTYYCLICWQLTVCCQSRRGIIKELIAGVFTTSTQKPLCMAAVSNQQVGPWKSFCFSLTKGHIKVCVEIHLYALAKHWFFFLSKVHGNVGLELGQQYEVLRIVPTLKINFFLSSSLLYFFIFICNCFRLSLFSIDRQKASILI